MILALSRDPAWVESLSPDLRSSIVTKLVASLDACESPREIASVAKAIAGLESNDIARTRLLLDAEAVEAGGSQETAQQLLADLAEIRRLSNAH